MFPADVAGRSSRTSIDPRRAADPVRRRPEGEPIVNGT
jgi:hypothetical protein